MRSKVLRLSKNKNRKVGNTSGLFGWLPVGFGSIPHLSVQSIIRWRWWERRYISSLLILWRLLSFLILWWWLFRYPILFVHLYLFIFLLLFYFLFLFFFFFF